MTEEMKSMDYHVMAKGKYDRRFHCYGYHSNYEEADRHAKNLAESLWTREVKMVYIDGNSMEERIYK